MKKSYALEEIERRCNNWKDIVWSASTSTWHLEGETVEECNIRLEENHLSRKSKAAENLCNNQGIY